MISKSPELERNDDIIYLFHHIHHGSYGHEVHHCGGKHPGADYTVSHCSCGLHRIDKQYANGDTINGNLKKLQLKIYFDKKCPEGGWHIESGHIIN